jgi:CDP-paratose 2-epimerase
MSSSRSGILVTGGAGFVGSHLAFRAKEAWPDARIVALDNLKRRGSELNLPRLRAAGIEFAHGDIRCPDDLEAISGDFDLLLECSAEPSVLAGYGGSPAYVVHTNLGGTFHCLEWARRRRADVLFLSTSRVYPIGPLNALRYRETASRFELTEEQPYPGASERGVAEDFPLTGARSLYGATKLSSEMLVEEYREMYGLRAVVNRCGVLAGPWQMGKADQGVFALWLLAHHYGRPLKYIGFGGSGKQVRDLLHVEDLWNLLRLQIDRMAELSGGLFNVGGGRACSLSLREATELCQALTGKTIPIESVTENRAADVPVYLTDNGHVEQVTGWTPRHTPESILEDIQRWVRGNEAALKAVF